MKPVEQTILAPPHGDCFRACIASILELPIEEVPNPHAPEEHWWEAWHEWLVPRGLQLVEWHLPRDQPVYCPLRGYWIATVTSPSRSCNHCIVMHDDAIAWDPSPTGKQSEENWTEDDQIHHVTLIVPLDPAASSPSNTMALEGEG
jgi:hypothetical protein